LHLTSFGSVLFLTLSLAYTEGVLNEGRLDETSTILER